jgi:DNA polymerase III gamma/tau subunit
MKKEAENSMLKFLEEPNPNIVAILMTNNVNNLLDTIISRCQFVKLNNENDNVYKEELYDKAIEYIMYIESDYEKLLVDSKKLWYDIVKEREDNYQLLGYMIDIYKNILNVKLGISSNIDNNKVKDIIVNNSIDKLNSKIKILLEYYDNIRNNVHIPMFLDSMIIELVGVR